MTFRDRDQIREILVAAGAPAEDLEQLVAACTSIDDARSYRPRPRDAWCIDCGGVSPCDHQGCLVCRDLARWFHDDPEVS